MMDPPKRGRPTFGEDMIEVSETRTPNDVVFNGLEMFWFFVRGPRG